MGDSPTGLLVGREAELEVIADALRAAREGQSRVVIVQGEPGIGKTRFLAAAQELAVGRGFDVLHGSAFEFEETRAFGAVVDALASGAMAASATIEREIARVRERLAGETSLEPELVDAVIDLIELMAIDRPVAFMIDDLQWADPATLHLLRAAGRRTRNLPVILLSALRRVPRTARAARLADVLVQEGAIEIGLSPLDDPAVEALVASVTGGPVTAPLLDQVAGARGNPFFVIELARWLARAPKTTHDGSRPPALRTVILRRLSFLPTETLDVLRTACVLGSAFSLSDVGIVAGLDLPAVTRSMSMAIDAGVIGEHGEQLVFRHDLVHEALYHDHPLAIRKSLHRTAGQRLAAAGAPAARVAVQLARGAEPGDREALMWLWRAMETARRSSIGVTTEFTRLACELALPGTVESDEAAIWFAMLHYWAGEFADAEAFARSRAPVSTGSAKAKLLFVVAASVEARGRVTEAAEALQTAVDVPGLEDFNRPLLLAELGFRRARLGDLDTADRLAVEALDMLAASGDTWLAPAAMVRCQVAGARGSIEEALRHGADAAESAAAQWTEGAWGFPFARLVYGWALLDADRLDDALREFREGRSEAERRGVTSHLPLYHGALAIACYLAGDLDESIIEAEAGLELIQELGTQRAALLMHAARARVLLHVGRIEDARAAVDAGAILMADREPEFGGDWLRWSQALVAEASGDQARAVAHLREAIDISALLPYFVVWRSTAPDAVRLALASGDREWAAAVTAHATEGARRAPGVATAQGTALRCEGLLNDDPGALYEAVDAYRRGPRPLERAAAAEDAAAAAARHRTGDRAVALFEEALTVYEAAGALDGAARTNAALRATGAKTRGSSAARRPSTGWGSLTPSEQRIVDLVARGLSNPEVAARAYISRRTVQAHLSNVFRKLGITSRAQLIIEATKRSRE